MRAGLTCAVVNVTVRVRMHVTIRVRVHVTFCIGIRSTIRIRVNVRVGIRICVEIAIRIGVEIAIRVGMDIAKCQTAGRVHAHVQQGEPKRKEEDEIPPAQQPLNRHDMLPVTTTIDVPGASTRVTPAVPTYARPAFVMWLAMGCYKGREFASPRGSPAR